MGSGNGTTVRDNPYKGPSRMAVPFPGHEPAKPADEDTDDAVEATDDGQAEDDQAEDDDEPAASSAPRRRAFFDPHQKSLTGALSPPRAGDLSGALFAVIAWSWIVLPLVQGGPSKVRDVWRAKWLNKGPDGKWLA